MSLKSITTGVAAAALVGAAAVGVTSIAAVPTSVSPAITPVVFGAPLPLDNDPDLAGQLTGLLNQLANAPTITENAGLIQGGVGIFEGRTANRLLTQAHQNGDFPLNLTVTNVSPPAPDGSVTVPANAAVPADWAIRCGTAKVNKRHNNAPTKSRVQGVLDSIFLNSPLDCMPFSILQTLRGRIAPKRGSSQSAFCKMLSNHLKQSDYSGDSIRQVMY